MSPAWSLVALSVPPFAVMDPMVTEESVGATLHTVLVVWAQAVFTPAAHVEVAALLLQRGANMSVKNGSNRLPITMSRNPDVTTVFKQAMAAAAIAGGAAAAAPQ